MLIIDDLVSVWIEQYFVGTKTQPLFGKVRTIDAIGIDLPRPDAFDQNVPIVKRTVEVWIQSQCVVRDWVVHVVKQEQLNRCGILGKEAKVYAVVSQRCSEGIRTTRAGF
jgi:hypothetical protein